MTRILAFLRSEPVAIVGLIQAVIALVIAFGADLTGEQQTALLGLAGAILVLAGVARQQVTPTAKIPTEP